VPTAVLLLQILWWRVRRPAGDVRALTFMLALALGAFALLAALPGSSAALAMPQGWLAVLYALALAGAVSLLYLITYATLEAKSPSTLIVLAAGKSAQGLTAEDAVALFSDDEFIVQRVDGLVRIGQLRRAGESLHLTLHGRIFLESFLLPRRIMGLQHWGG